MQPTARTMQPPVWPASHTRAILGHMFTPTRTAALLTLILVPFSALFQDPPTPKTSPEYTADAQLKRPEDYRNWIYLTSGFDMSYSASSEPPDHHMFDNVFVNPDAYKAFLATGTWPDKTMFVLEVRGAHSKGSINQRGDYQGDLMGVEVHVKDEQHFPNKWAFFQFDDNKTAKMTPTTTACYSCHSEHGAVDNTFVQFYPTLLPIATAKNTLTPAYLKEIAVPADSPAKPAYNPGK
jgi:hypothetical protein